MSAERTPRGGFRLHLLLLLVLLVEVALAFARHRSDEELERLWERGDPRERLAALHVLTNRGEPHPSRFGQDFVRRLLAEEPPIFEAAFANEICKFEPPAIQNEVITDIPLESAGLLWRAFVLHKNKVGGPVVGAGKRMKLEDLRLFLDAVHPERQLSADRVAQYVRDQTAMYRQQREQLEALRGSAAGYEED